MKNTKVKNILDFIFDYILRLATISLGPKFKVTETDCTRNMRAPQPFAQNNIA